MVKIFEVLEENKYIGSTRDYCIITPGNDARITGSIQNFRDELEEEILNKKYSYGYIDHFDKDGYIYIYAKDERKNPSQFLREKASEKGISLNKLAKGTGLNRGALAYSLKDNGGVQRGVTTRMPNKLVKRCLDYLGEEWK